ncbi:MAG: hypothetical protein ACOCUH_04270 [Bacteriovoracia bacterium]
MPKAQTLEKGNIYFFYRPKVEEESVEGIKDVQRMYMVLSPEKHKDYRLAIIGRKHLPDPSKKGKGKIWGFVDMVAKSPDEIEKELQEEHYDTKTRGQRTIPAARVAGEGVYRIVNHNGHTHLAYSLELPKKEGEVQKEFEINDEASYIINIKNPEKPAPKNTGLSNKKQAHFPKTLQNKFEDRKFYALNPPHYLDYEGAEFIMVSAAKDIKNELGITLNTEDENQNDADVYNDLHIDKEKHPVEPLFKGKWA